MQEIGGENTAVKKYEKHHQKYFNQLWDCGRKERYRNTAVIR